LRSKNPFENFGQIVMSIGLLLFFLFVLVANVAIGYIIAILLGIGPPDFRIAWTRIKLSVLGRFKKHTPPTSREPELPTVTPVEAPTVTQVAESTATPTPPVPPATPAPATPSLTSPPPESSGNNPVNAEQPKPSA